MANTKLAGNDKEQPQLLPRICYRTCNVCHRLLRNKSHTKFVVQTVSEREKLKGRETSTFTRLTHKNKKLSGILINALHTG
jgi:hypothetical protein